MERTLFKAIIPWVVWCLMKAILVEGFQSLVIFSVREGTQLLEETITLKNAPRFAKSFLQRNLNILLLKMAILSQSFVFCLFLLMHRIEIQNLCSNLKLKENEICLWSFPHHVLCWKISLVLPAWSTGRCHLLWFSLQIDELMSFLIIIYLTLNFNK